MYIYTYSLSHVLLSLTHFSSLCLSRLLFLFGRCVPSYILNVAPQGLPVRVVHLGRSTFRVVHLGRSTSQAISGPLSPCTCPVARLFCTSFLQKGVLGAFTNRGEDAEGLAA